MTHTSQRFCLRWNNHHSNLLSVFDQLLLKESFVDVTLAVEGQLLKAHKVILSACSPYFETLFVNHPDKHPIVILKDVPFADMRSLLDFIYRGEVSVDQDRLTGFLKVAESLRIKGLTEVNEEKCDLPSIASSLLSSNTQQATAPPPAAPPPPPPPSLHRIHLGQPSSSPSPSSLSSPGAASKRCIPSPSTFQPFTGNANSNSNGNGNANGNANGDTRNGNDLRHNDLANASSSCYGQKRKRGRPRKLSGSSDTPSGASPAHDPDDSENRMSSLSLSNLSDSSYAHGPPDLLEVNMTEHSQHSPSSFSEDQNIESPLADDSCLEISEDCCVKTEPNDELSAPGTSSFVECGSPRMRDSPGSRSQSQTPTNSSERYPPDKCQWKEILKRLKKPEISIQVEKHERQYDDTPFLKCRRNFYAGGDSDGGSNSNNNSNSNSNSNNGLSKRSAIEQEGYSSGDGGSKGGSAAESMEWYMDTQSASHLYGDGDDDVDDEDEAMVKYEYDSLRASAAAAANDGDSSPGGVGVAAAAAAAAAAVTTAATNSCVSASTSSLPTGGGGAGAGAETAATKPLDKSSVRRYCVQVAEHLFQCTLCYKTYTHISNFSRHFLSAHHGLRQEIPCPVCYRIFTRRDNMLTHMKQVHRITVTRGLATSLIQKLSAGSNESSSPSSTGNGGAAAAAAVGSGSGSGPGDSRANSGAAS